MLLNSHEYDVDAVVDDDGDDDDYESRLGCYHWNGYRTSVRYWPGLDEVQQLHRHLLDLRKRKIEFKNNLKKKINFTSKSNRNFIKNNFKSMFNKRKFII